MNKIGSRILEMQALDESVRSRLLKEGTLYEGYHPEMEAVHNQNALELEKIIDQIGWPIADLVGVDASSAAWLITQHAISQPKFQKKCLALLKERSVQIPLSQLAALEDRILFFEGKSQIYGTNFDWDENGEMSPSAIQDPEKVDELRMKMGLDTLAVATERIRKSVRTEGGQPPTDLDKRKREFLAWVYRVGWRQ